MRLEVRGKIFGAADVALAQLEARAGQGARELRLFEHRARRREQQAHAAAAKLLQRLHALAGHLGMRLDLAEAFARRIQRHRDVIDQRLEVGEPSFRVAHLIGDHDDEPLRQRARQRGNEDRIAAAGESADAQGRARDRADRA